MGTLQRWLRLHLTRDGREEKAAAVAYQHMLDSARPKMLEVHARIRACPHTNRRPNPDSLHGGEICNDCGVGYRHLGRQR